ncbi:MAG: LuxR C-terminal-related transcriptional regulator [Actinomycetia bacterium]|nr:LuxR C-terminal-related transcriptional regulator [Actinomycetes bacterium]
MTQKPAVFSRIRASLGRLWQTRDELKFNQIRLPYTAYILPLTILLILHDLRSTFFFGDETLWQVDVVTLNYIAFAIGALVVLLFFRRQVIWGMRVLAMLLAVGFIFWLLVPAGNPQIIALLVVHFGIGGCTIYAVYTHVFVLKNAERLFSMCLAVLIYGLFTFLYHSGISGVILAQVVPGLLIVILVVCVFTLQAETFPENSQETAISPPPGIYIVLICPFAFFIIDVFGEGLVNNLPSAEIALRGIGTMVAVVLALIIQFGFRRSVWYMLNLFLILSTAGILLLTLINEPIWRSLGSFIFGVGDGVGYIMIFYIVGIIKKYHNAQFFWNITLATIGAIFFSALIASILQSLSLPAMEAAAVIFSVGFLFAFQILSPLIQRNLFATDWFEELSGPDNEFALKRVEQVDRFSDLGLSPREREVASYLLRGLSVRQISSVIGVRESTTKGYCKTLYRKLNINSRAELFVRFGVIAEASEQLEEAPTELTTLK